MIYTIVHTTTYSYFEPVSLCHNIARLIPRSFGKQTCKKSIVTISPLPGIKEEYEDFFGNKLMYFAIQQEHKKLTVTVSSEIEIFDYNHPTTNLYSDIAWEDVTTLTRLSTPGWLDVQQYIPETSFTAATPEIKSYALQSFRPGISMLDASYDLMQRIYRDFEFKPGFTTISTPLLEVMKAGKGVCQDFAHLAIACIRSMGLPARYVSGYLETIAAPGKEKLVGTDASHAWFSVYIPYQGWIDFDPTNNQLPSNQYITACWGRDYADIAPLKGVIINSGPHELFVSVDVKRLGW